MNQNLFQVLSDDDLDEILLDHRSEIVLVLYGTKTCQRTRRIKPKFVELAHQYSDFFFVYVDLLRYKTDGRYSKDINRTPTFLFFHNMGNIGHMIGDDARQLFGLIQHFQMKLHERKEECASEHSEKNEDDGSEGDNNKQEMDNVKKKFLDIQLKRLQELQAAQKTESKK